MCAALLLSSAFFSPSANYSGHAAGILTTLGEWKEVWGLCFGCFGGGGRNEHTLTMSVSTRVGILFVSIFFLILCV